MRYLLRMAAVIVAFVLVQAAPAQAAGNPFFGTFTDNLSSPIAKEQADLTRQAATGIGVIREHIFWDRIETKRGFYDWTRLDQLVGDAADRGLRILPVLLNPPAFYVTRPKGSTGAYPPDDPVDMGIFAMKLAHRYGPGGTFWCTPGCRANYNPITQWQVWNEPDYPSLWKGKPNAFEYVPLLTAVAAFIHLADPKAQIVSGGLTRTAVTSGYLDTMLALGAGYSFDSVGFHPYEGTVAEVVADIRAMRAKLNSYGLNSKGIYVTEFTWADQGSRPWVTTPRCAAALTYAMARRFETLSPEVKLVGAVHFMWNDRPDPTGGVWPLHAGLITTSGAAKPVLGAFTAAVHDAAPPTGLTPSQACPSALQPAARRTARTAKSARRAGRSAHVRWSAHR